MNYKDDHFSQCQMSKVRLINLAFYALLLSITSSRDSIVGSETVRGDCALLWFNPLLEGQVEIRNSYDSLPTFIPAITSRQNTHTHTHTHIYIYIYTYIQKWESTLLGAFSRDTTILEKKQRVRKKKKYPLFYCKSEEEKKIERKIYSVKSY